jgi:hypothetical protein
VPSQPDRSTPPNRRVPWQKLVLRYYAPTRMRELALTVTDPDVLAEFNLLIAELERRARLKDNGGTND